MGATDVLISMLSLALKPQSHVVKHRPVSESSKQPNETNKIKKYFR